jgi:hypothetical protein
LGAWRRARPRRRLSPAAQLALFTVLGALLLTTVEPSAGANRAGLALALGFLVALPLTTLTYAATIEASYRQLSSRWSSLQVLPPALAVALACALLSRVAHFEPGYVYGLFAGYAAVSRPALSRVDKGRGIVLACLFTLSASLAAWVAREWLRQQWPPGAHGFGLLVADNLLTAVFVAGVEGVVFSLIPLRFMHGFTLARWSLPAWASLCLVGMFGLVHVLLDPKAPQGGDAGQAPLVSALVLFIAFGVFSLAFWAWFRWRRLSP